MYQKNVLNIYLYINGYLLIVPIVLIYFMTCYLHLIYRVINGKVWLQRNAEAYYMNYVLTNWILSACIIIHCAQKNAVKTYKAQYIHHIF